MAERSESECEVSRRVLLLVSAQHIETAASLLRELPTVEVYVVSVCIQDGVAWADAKTGATCRVSSMYIGMERKKDKPYNGASSFFLIFTALESRT